MYEKVSISPEAASILINGYFRKLEEGNITGLEALRNTVSLLESIDGAIEEVMRDEELRTKYLLMKTILIGLGNGTIQEVEE